MRVNIKFFYLVYQIFQVEFLVSGFSNLRFANLNSSFGVASLTISVLMITVASSLQIIISMKLTTLRKLKADLFEAKTGLFENRSRSEVLLRRTLDKKI